MNSVFEERVEDNDTGHSEEYRFIDEDEDNLDIIALPNIPTMNREAMYYDMTHKKRGVAIIFNHSEFDLPKLKPRNGTNIDCNNLEEALKGLGFQVTVFNNLIYKEVMKHISEAANADHADHDCICVCVLSHGDLGMLYAKDRIYSYANLWDSFTADKCPTLEGKPKMFFIQACQGEGMDKGVILHRTESDGPTSSSHIPIHPDFLISCSTGPGFTSWRNPELGSWFIQSLAENLQLHGKGRNILTLLTFVSQQVAYDYESNTPGNPFMHQQKQMPCITTMLTRLLVFGDKN